ncbi:hypothetical protein SeLEV6574_g04758 [Synchytrium endobioticum]|uniref:E3 ubiquitin-protein ligase APD1-4 middle domain-containing protein n=1 Tax=Synchytrium endobioticum TaxID=286115 RepID=A0A507CY34_9FUNG|nr:hypothetical protein SeLEV6574_g04758 [Synchytrium endobioticum]
MEGVGTLSFMSHDQDRSSHGHSESHHHSSLNRALPGIMAGGLLGYMFGRSRTPQLPVDQAPVRRPVAWSRQRSSRTLPRSPMHNSNTVPVQPSQQPRSVPPPPPYSHVRHHVTLPTPSSPPPVPQNPARRWTCSFCLLVLFGFIVTIIIVASTIHPAELTRKLIMGERFLEEVDGRWLEGLTITGASEVSAHVFMTKPRVGELVHLPPKKIQINLGTGQYHYIVYSLLGGSTIDLSWNFNSVVGLPPRVLIIRSNDAFEQWRSTGGVRGDMTIHEQVANSGEYSFTTAGDENSEYYFVFFQANVASRTSGTADFKIISNTYALTNPAPVESCKVADKACGFKFKPLQEPYYLLLLAPSTGDSYTVTVNYDQRESAVVAVFVTLSAACLVCLTIIAVSWCGAQVLYLLFMSMVESVYRRWLNMTNCCRGIGRRLSPSNLPAPSYYDDEYDPELESGGVERQPLILPSAPVLESTNGGNGQPVLPYNPSFYDLPRPELPPPPYTPLDQHTDPSAPRHPSRGGRREGGQLNVVVGRLMLQPFKSGNILCKHTHPVHLSI